ncbi:lysylphosphatidylglycerol synthase transmembrane domain-containing protein [Kribbella soli]|uniref:Flippase-like domain-containing protein n=1 Tax=Kribbella soli TaxID=1124743 RepID=A0A4R0HFN2_9ACTN|nr:lysylphosphatidylglycerol synthase transmembrane domain-containing protein [Kribbella soli]TCC08474.1 flippase-like domain-containing protein [Kribbella soli]
MDGATGPRPAWHRWVWSATSLVVVFAVVEYVVLPKLTLARESLARVAHLNPAWVIAGIVLEACCLVSYSLFTRALLGSGQVRFSWILRTDVTGYGVSHVIPGGAATATAIRFRLLQAGGARPSNITATITAEAIGSYAALLLIAWLTSIPALFLRDATSAYLIMFLIGLAAMASCVLAVRERSALERLAARLLRASLHRLPRRTRPWIASVALRLRDLLADHEVRRAFLIWATLNWLLDAAVLWTFLAAYGEPLNPIPLLLAYCAANLAAAVPLTPGGIAVVEGIAISTLLGFGVDGQAAVLAVLSWRLVQFWGPVPVAGLCYLSLQAQSATARAKQD